MFLMMEAGLFNRAIIIVWDCLGQREKARYGLEAEIAAD
jgi:hypothetical protein